MSLNHASCGVASLMTPPNFAVWWPEHQRTGPSLSRRRTPKRISIAGAREAPIPDFVELCHPVLVAKAPAGEQWLHEIKVDGYRAQIHVRDGNAQAYTRRGHDWSDRFASAVAAAAALPVRQAILDGEIIAPGENSLSDFAALQSELASGGSDRLVFYAFDLLYLDGFDLRGAPLFARKQNLSRLIRPAKSQHLLYAEEFVGDGETLHGRMCAAGLEGLVSKLRDAPYSSGRNDSWVKVTCRKRDSFVVIGFIPAPGKSVTALYLGRMVGDELFYAGKAAAGLTGEAARHLRRILEPLKRKTTPLTKRVSKPKAQWVEPRVLVDAEYRGITNDGRLRHASFKGLRDDLMQQPVATSRPLHPSPPTRPDPSTIKRLRYNIQTLLPNAVVPTKDALRAYWRRVGPTALNYLGNRPLTLVRHRDGLTFFHTRRLPVAGSGVRLMKFAKREGGEGTRAFVDSVQGLLGLVDMDVVEIHPWNATVDDIERPDQMLFDLDPGDGVPWELVCETALRMHDIFRSAGLDPWPKATGGKGLHVVVPIQRSGTHDQVAAIAQGVAVDFARTDRRYTTTSGAKNRRGKIYIDFRRNGRGQTGVGAFSPRARPNFPIAVPFTWAEVERGLPADAYTMSRLPPL